ncbi:MAG: protein-(glutamine-N5) methyltransferase, release factor-specific [Nitrospirae bacterium RIFCSPHIGHO2_01_FULL_66_17]|nr:MAG: protein-(glutamine-N5) methyltransferase, release factor-specific [Nitrospirae bacterium RIFCSPHIGHO2_01_FULL_66_17]
MTPAPRTRMQGALWGARRLDRAGVAAPRAEAEGLLAHVLSQPKHACYLEPDAPLTADETARLRSLVARRADGVPLQYLTGTETFRGLELEVTPDVLIPRPETEGVVDAALRVLAERRPAGPPVKRHQQAAVERHQQAAAVVADIGTGSGCLALALARVRPDVVVYATDCSAAALAVAERNARRLGLADRVTFLCGDLFEPLARAGVRVDLVVSNPPYVADEHLPTLQIEVRHEPESALRGGVDGLHFYRRIVAEAGSVLAACAGIVVELGYGQADAVGALARGAGFDVARIDPDFQRIPRVMTLAAPRPLIDAVQRADGNRRGRVLVPFN